MNERISVIVPAYNVQDDIDSCVKSILTQSYENIEVIVVNDGSTDKTEEKCNQFLKDRRFKILNTENAGPARARNIGMENASGTWILFVDADDQIHEDLCGQLYEQTMKYKADMVFCNLENRKDNGQRESLIPFRGGGKGIFRKKKR